jgi:hypothetical protein
MEKFGQHFEVALTKLDILFCSLASEVMSGTEKRPALLSPSPHCLIHSFVLYRPRLYCLSSVPHLGPHSQDKFWADPGSFPWLILPRHLSFDRQALPQDPNFCLLLDLVHWIFQVLGWGILQGFSLCLWAPGLSLNSFQMPLGSPTHGLDPLLTHRLSEVTTLDWPRCGPRSVGTCCQFSDFLLLNVLQDGPG